MGTYLLGWPPSSSLLCSWKKTSRCKNEGRVLSPRCPKNRSGKKANTGSLLSKGGQELEATLPFLKEQQVVFSASPSIPTSVCAPHPSWEQSSQNNPGRLFLWNCQPASEEASSGSQNGRFLARKDGAQPGTLRSHPQPPAPTLRHLHRPLVPEHARAPGAKSLYKVNTGQQTAERPWQVLGGGALGRESTAPTPTPTPTSTSSP